MKVCTVGLDGATWDLLDPWLDDLPTIRSFAETARGDLRSCVPPLSIPAWKCFSTGMHPGDLGVFTFVEPDFADERFETVSSETFTHNEIWDYLGEAGHRSAAINMPSTSPPRDIDGWMVSGPFSDADDFARPESLQEELAGDYTVLPDYYLSRDPADLTAARDSVRDKFDLGLRLSADADYVHLTVYVTDTVQHTEWDSPVCKEFWEAVDAELGRFVDRLGDEWNVVLLSDHGFGPSEGRFYLNTWLEERGYMNYEGSFDLGDAVGAVGLDYQTIYGMIHRLRLDGLLRTVLPSSLLLRIARQMPGNRKLEGTQDKLDWDSDAIALAPLIYTKTPGIADDIRDDLLALTDDSGEEVVDEVHYGAELYPDCDVRVPDLIVEHTDYVISDIVKPGTVFEYDLEGDMIAHHRPTGIVAARGPDVHEADLQGARLFDVAPTVLDGFGVDIPEEMRGRSLGLLGRESQREPVPVRRDTERVIDHDEAVEQKLEDLGYL
ncbi:alkaline phosphatase family protein [Halosimplex amylolyticum]|uniref:alkaline phosphatase family protein n=1 Tax=Halosimplex amylolyticum TaxID=3396616 RepID=UPI003F559CAD